MAVDTDEILEKDEDLKATEMRIVELRKNAARTPEEEKEFAELKKHHRGRVEEQILNEREKADKQAERAAAAEQALADARARLEAIENKKQEQVSRGTGAENEAYEINGKRFYTDEAIVKRIELGLMTQKEGWAMQRQAIKEEAKAEMGSQGVEQVKQEKAKEIRNESLKFVRDEGMGWMLDEKDPKFNAKDPLYIEANRLWQDGLQYDPDGPRKALLYAKRLLGKDVTREDRTEEFSVAKNNASDNVRSQRENKISLNETEESNAIKWYVEGNLIDPKTGKAYTPAGALQKALEAKRKRLAK